MEDRPRLRGTSVISLTASRSVQNSLLGSSFSSRGTWVCHRTLEWVQSVAFIAPHTTWMMELSSMNATNPSSVMKPLSLKIAKVNKGVYWINEVMEVRVPAVFAIDKHKDILDGYSFKMRHAYTAGIFCSPLLLLLVNMDMNKSLNECWSGCWCLQRVVGEFLIVKVQQEAK